MPRSIRAAQITACHPKIALGHVQVSTTELWADGNDDGIVDALDYNFWNSNFNNTLAKLW